MEKFTKKKYNKSVAQVIVRWLVEQDIIVLTKSVNPSRMAQNILLWGFYLVIFSRDRNVTEKLNDSAIL